MIISSINTTDLPKKNNNIVSDKINITFFGLFAFVCGLPIAYAINLMGELYGTEVLLPVFTILLLLSDKEKPIFKEKTFWMFVLSLIVMMMGYIISDLVAGTSSHNYLRAWGRNAILFSDVICLSIIAATDKRYLWWYIFGVSVGSIIYLQLTGVPFTNANWKIAYCAPILLLMLVSGYFLPSILTVWLTSALGVFSFFMDSRSFSSTCILLAFIFWLRRGNPESLKISTGSLIKILLAGAFAVSLILVILAQSNKNEGYDSRRDQSSYARSSAIRIGVGAIMDSPILGFGSWGEGTKKYAKQFYEETHNELGRLTGNMDNQKEGKSFMPHSQILGVWMEGGIFAAQLFIYYGFKILAALKTVILNRRFDYMISIYCFYLLSAFWHLFMSPYSGGHRLGIAISIAIICSINIENKIERRRNNLDSNLPIKNLIL